ncbi:hypothetical protein Tco_0212888 [Tanacetum coccineum]
MSPWSRILALGWHLEEIHVTWAHLKKKQTRLWTYTRSLEELCKHVKEKQNSSSHDPVTVTGGVKRGTGTSTNSDVNVDQNALNSGMNTLGKTFGNSNAERANTVGKESESLNSSPTGIASSHIVSFATLVKGDTSRKSVNFCTLITSTDNDADVFVSKESVCVVNEQLNNIVYGYFWANVWLIMLLELLLDLSGMDLLVGEWSRKIEKEVLHNLKKPSRLFEDSRLVQSLSLLLFIDRSNLLKRRTRLLKMPKVTKVTNATTSILNSFDALNTLVDEDNCGGMNYASTQEPKQVEGNEKKDINTSVPSSSCYKTPISVKTNGCILDGKPLNKVDSDSESEVEVVYDETTQFMASGGANDASLYKDEDYDIYDTYDPEGLTKQQSAFCDMMDINLCGHIRRVLLSLLFFDCEWAKEAILMGRDNWFIFDKPNGVVEMGSYHVINHTESDLAHRAKSLFGTGSSSSSSSSPPDNNLVKQPNDDHLISFGEMLLALTTRR